jgi:hypothetical protein
MSANSAVTGPYVDQYTAANPTMAKLKNPDDGGQAPRGVRPQDSKRLFIAAVHIQNAISHFVVSKLLSNHPEVN